MSDLIDRQAAIDALCKTEPEIRWMEAHMQWQDDMSAVLDVPSAQPERKGRWIPCSEQPAEFPCIACDGFGQIFIPVGVVGINGECYDGKNYRFNPGQFLKGEVVETGGGQKLQILPRKIIAWIPLPEPYKEGGE